LTCFCAFSPLTPGRVCDSPVPSPGASAPSLFFFVLKICESPPTPKPFEVPRFYPFRFFTAFLGFSPSHPCPFFLSPNPSFVPELLIGYALVYWPQSACFFARLRVGPAALVSLCTFFCRSACFSLLVWADNPNCDLTSALQRFFGARFNYFFL